MTFKKLNLVAAMVLALLLPILLVGCGEEDTDNQPDLTRSDVEEIVRAEIAKVPAATPAAPGLSRNEVEQVVQASIAGIPEPSTVPVLTRADIEEVVQTAVEAAMAQMPGPKPAEPGLTLADVRQVVQAAMANMPEPDPGLTRADVEEFIHEAIAEVAEPEPRLTREEVLRLARNTVATIPLKSAPADYTKFFVDNAISRYDAGGLDDTLSYYNRVESVDGQWYVFIIDENDEVIGHYDAHLLGQDLKGPIGTDANGYNFGPGMLSATEDGKWVSYVYRNPESEIPGSDHIGTHEYKHVWVVRHDGLLFASGWYVSADEFTKFFVDEAIRKYHSEGLDATVAYYNSPGNVNGQWFAFLADRKGMIISHYNPTMLGQDLDDLLGTDMFTAKDEGSWVTHTDVNPATGEVGDKHFWLVSHDGLVFGSGWHHDELGS